MKYNNLIIELCEMKRGTLQNWHYELFENISPETQAKKMSYDINFYHNEVNFECLNINLNYYVSCCLNNYKNQVVKKQFSIHSDRYLYIVNLSFTV